MKKILFIILFIPVILSAQQLKYETQKVTEGKYTYEKVTNDPLDARIYTLENGLKVYLTVYKDAPRIQTYIAVRAGSKYDPSNTTGLAHYLEHILFKGTSKIGSSEWEKEKPELDKIEALYEIYRKTKDTLQRVKIYHQIDSISLVAATYAIANEYDKLLSNIGATGTNAYTSVEQTVYVNDIPSNQFEKWVQIEAERFSEVVPRLFHTELEAVYEEKNRALDNDNSKVWYTLMEGLFPTHPYGTQTTIGTVEHLKNPSITEIKKYFEKYYAPNNMAICLSGDLDPAATIAIIDKYFSKLKSKKIEPIHLPKESPQTSVTTKNVYGPTAESVILAYRFQGTDEQKIVKDSITDVHMIRMISMILNNGKAGLIDLNLNQKQRTLNSYAYEAAFNEYSLLALGGKPKAGQSLDEVRDLLLAQIDSLKQGKFKDWLPEAALNNYRISKLKQFESNANRADLFVDAFISDLPWKYFVEEINLLSRISKKQIIDFSKAHFNNNYVIVYKRQGTDTTIHKIGKPVISAVSVNREKQSAFYKMVFSKPSPTLKPVFVNFEKDMKKVITKNGITVLYKKNEENELFNFYILWDIGRDNDPIYPMAVAYMDYLGTSTMTADQVKEEFFKLGCSYSFSSTNDNLVFSLSGLSDNFIPALEIFEQLITSAKPDEQALKDLTARILKTRHDNKTSKDVILKSAMVNYAKYGTFSPFTNILSKDQLQNLKPEDLTKAIADLVKFNHRILYYGPTDSKTLGSLLIKNHKAPATLTEVPTPKKMPFKEMNENKVYWVDYEMVQAEVLFLTKSITYDKSLAPVVFLFNEYFGGNMGSIVFQEMRESKALAYSVYSRYESASRKEYPNYITSYIGTQADKLTEAINGMDELLENLPLSEALFDNAKTSCVEVLVSQRVTKAKILLEYERLNKLGINYDIRKDAYNQVKTMTFQDLKNFHDKYYKGKKKVLLIVGSKDRIDFKDLKKYGEVEELKLDEIFGY